MADSTGHRVIWFDDEATTGSGVLGQASYSNTMCNQNLPTAHAFTLCGPEEVLLFAQGGKLLVADTLNHRVLVYPLDALSNASATQVFGQPDFVSNGPNRDTLPSADSLFEPKGLALDSLFNLYVGTALRALFSSHLSQRTPATTGCSSSNTSAAAFGPNRLFGSSARIITLLPTNLSLRSLLSAAPPALLWTTATASSSQTRKTTV